MSDGAVLTHEIIDLIAARLRQYVGQPVEATWRAEREVRALDADEDGYRRYAPGALGQVSLRVVVGAPSTASAVDANGAPKDDPFVQELAFIARKSAHEGREPA